MTIEFRCDVCQKLLRTGDDKAGATAKCPQCGSPVTVPTAAFVSAPPVVAAGDSLAAAPPVLSSSQPRADERPCPMCGESIKKAATRCRFCGESFAPAAGVAGGAGEVPPRDIDIGSIMSRAWKIFQKEMGMCLAIVWIPALIIGAVYASMMVMIDKLIIGGRNPAAGEILTLLGAMAFFMLALFGIIIWLAPGTHLALLRLVRGERPEIADVFRGGRFSMRMLGSSIVIGLVMFGITFVIGGVLMVPAAFLANDHPEFMVIPILATYGSVLILSIFVQAATWPFVWVLVDRDPPGIGCISQAMAMTKGKRLMSFVKQLVEQLVMGAGYLACFIGIIFSVPLAMVMIAVSYCDVAGHATSEG